MADTDSQPQPSSNNPAVDLIRQKIARVYQSEPNASQEIPKTEVVPKRSKHQEFMHQLSTSGKSLAEIQTAWHNYYIGLPDTEKHKVWQEFYEANDKTKQYKPQAQTPDNPLIPGGENTNHVVWDDNGITKRRSVSDIKSEILSRAGSTHKPTRKQHVQSLFFGLSVGGLAVLLLLFGFFNERFIAPFITPSRAVSSTPIIIDPSSTTAGPNPEIIIPKINVELPIIFDEQSADEKAIQRSLEDGVLHYPTTSYPGEEGNGAIFGHSSNNILNKGKYKFAFVLLKRLDPGDTFMIQYKSKRYVYKVFDKKIVKPEDVGVLGNTDKPATFALITCDPPGTSINRLVVWGEQINPDPISNIASSANKNAPAPKILPSNSPTLWQRIRSWFSS